MAEQIDQRENMEIYKFVQVIFLTNERTPNLPQLISIKGKSYISFYTFITCRHPNIEKKYSDSGPLL